MEMPGHVVRSLMNMYCNNRYCTPRVVQYHRSEQMHGSQYKLNNYQNIPRTTRIFLKYFFITSTVITNRSKITPILTVKVTSISIYCNQLEANA